MYCAYSNNTVSSGPQAPKSSEEVAMIEKATHTNFLFVHLNKEQKGQVYESMYKVEAKKGEDIIKQGDKGNSFYVVVQG